MTTLDTILSWALPIGAVLFIGVAFFGKIKEPLFAFFNWLREMFGAGVSKVKDGDVPKPNFDGTIIYR